MSYMYDTRRRADSKAQAEKKNSFASGPSMDALRSGMAKPSAQQMGSRVDIPEALRARFEESFGADLSSVKLYQSQAVADAGANAIAQGSNIAFAPGKLDFSSFGGKALLGHELSHVVSQQRGEVRGGGFLENPALEARADREGAMAAAGQTIYGGAAAPLSAASAAPAAGPMQADKPKDADKKANKMLAIHMAQKREMDVSDKDSDFLFENSTTYNDDVIRALMRAKVASTKNVQNRRELDQGGKDYTLSENYDVQRMQSADELMDKMFKQFYSQNHSKKALNKKLKMLRAENYSGKTAKEAHDEAEDIYSAAQQGDSDYTVRTNSDASEEQRSKMRNDLDAEEELTNRMIAENYEKLHPSKKKRRKK